MKIQTRVVKKQVKVGDLFFNLGIEPREHNVYEVEFDLKVNTPYGYHPIRTLFTTERQQTVTTYFKNGKRVSTSAHHQFRLEGGEWKKVHEIKLGDRVETKYGVTEVTKQNYKGKSKVLYDLSVENVHCYYSNGIVSHNSWLCIGAAAEAVKLGYNVNYYTLELGEDYVGKRFDACVVGKDIDFLTQHRDLVEQQIKTLPGNLIIKEYAPKTAGISTIKAHIQRCTDMGMKPDLVIIDYLDYVRPPSKSRYTDRKDEIDDVYVSAKSLAKELKIPVISPSQVNRSGAKDDVVEGDKAAGSYDKMMVADISFSLSRKKEDKVLGTGRFHLMKNRFGMDGITFNIKFDSSTGTMTVEGTSDDSPTTTVGNNSSGGSFSVDTQLLASFFGKGSTGFE